MDESKGSTNQDLIVMIEGASELVTQLQNLSEQIDERLNRGSSVDDVIEILNDQKGKVDTLRQLSRQITSTLGIDESGCLHQPIPERAKIAFEDLMRNLTRLVETQSRIESLIAAKGIPISGLIKGNRR